jgi:hypothetical protein
VKQSHLKNLLKNEFIVAQLTYKTNPSQVQLRQAFENRCDESRPTAKQIGASAQRAGESGPGD